MKTFSIHSPLHLIEHSEASPKVVLKKRPTVTFQLGSSSEDSFATDNEFTIQRQQMYSQKFLDSLEKPPLEAEKILLENSIVAIKLNHSLDPLKQLEMHKAKDENLQCFFPQKKTIKQELFDLLKGPVVNIRLRETDN